MTKGTVRFTAGRTEGFHCDEMTRCKKKLNLFYNILGLLVASLCLRVFVFVTQAKCHRWLAYAKISREHLTIITSGDRPRLIAEYTLVRRYFLSMCDRYHVLKKSVIGLMEIGQVCNGGNFKQMSSR